MESLRPDEDQLAERGNGGASGKGGRSGEAGGGSGPPGMRPLWLLLVLVVVCAGAGGWLAWEQAQRIAALESRLATVKSDVRTNQMELGVVDEEREETGQAISEQLEMLDDEMRKLWVVAHQTNRPRIEKLEEQTDTLESRVEELGAGQQSQAGRLDELAGSIEGMPDAGELRASVEEQVQGVRDDLDNRIQSLQQGRRLALEELRARLDGLESSVAGLEEKVSGSGEVSALKEQLTELESVVDSIDSSRAQLTQRFVRLQERVDRLADRQSAGGS
ncbi:hypothetical protein [Halospina sp. K52047b]|uniref:hypothetical protein n=1 Tax=Halospina sp. K52047b TaxID=2614160 RepID=UPI001249EF74|nr:hypothetical protein [Halospina sp. K52047b]KAA8985173.1 hypothetical protein F3089_00315 [Halospina sp. K52047b]